MKQHKFKRMAYDLMELMKSDRFEVDYKYNMIWLSHFDDSYEEGVRNFFLYNRVDKDSEILTKFELAKKVIKGECLIDERNNQS
ncbi:hypothetical protein B2G94_10180 [Staphylococcus hominis subsp. hominis]|uniref:hypothetical protein n=1 Tax=Staphylococcus hominis TaxID=1290 RepID=UPI000B3B9631|nr:hypothetical protein [Staphylococcus hominis]AUJ52934.1 hypothetical protein B7P03_10185 [Staphylococcus hominis subsp. hominis]OUL45105.1 hypothetical protein B2G94_10180 [Staphylococcus hominis subsp. hominis]